jgi:hypothetical protein
LFLSASDENFGRRILSMQAFWYLRKRVFHRSKELHIGLAVYMERNTPKLSQKIDSFKNCFSLFSVLLLESY